jgi:hypothetical protein
MMRVSFRLCGAAAALAVIAAGSARVSADTVEDQITTIADAMQAAVRDNAEDWSHDQQAAYVEACRDALTKHLKDPLSAEDLTLLTESTTQWARDSLSSTLGEDALDAYTAGIEYAVEQMCQRRPLSPTEKAQKKIDGQIDAFCDELEPAVVAHFVPEYTSQETAAATVRQIRKGLKASSRNPWFAALKRPLSKHDEKEMPTEIVERTLQTQLDDFEQAKKQGRELKFDWGETSAWSAATKFASKTIHPPTDRMIVFTRSPGMASIAIQVKWPAMAPAGEDDLGADEPGL